MLNLIYFAFCNFVFSPGLLQQNQGVHPGLDQPIQGGHVDGNHHFLDSGKFCLTLIVKL